MVETDSIGLIICKKPVKFILTRLIPYHIDPKIYFEKCPVFVFRFAFFSHCIINEITLTEAPISVLHYFSQCWELASGSKVCCGFILKY